MTNRDAVNIPLTFLSISAPNWIPLLQNFWAIVLPICGFVLVCLQIAYYWKMIRKK